LTFSNSSALVSVAILAADKAYLVIFSLFNWKKNDGLGRIRTGDLRHIKAGDLGVFEAFSMGDITVRKANDPSYIV
jgi:hypothetical protein